MHIREAVVAALVAERQPLVVDADARRVNTHGETALARSRLACALFFVLTKAPSPIGHAGIYSHKNSLGSMAAFCTAFITSAVFPMEGRPAMMTRSAGWNPEVIASSRA